MKNSEIPQVCASLIKWEKGFGIANSSELIGKNGYGFGEVLVKSPKTGLVKRFSVDQEEAIENECWDGEFAIFRDEDKKLAIKIWNY